MDSKFRMNKLLPPPPVSDNYVLLKTKYGIPVRPDQFLDNEFECGNGRDREDDGTRWWEGQWRADEGQALWGRRARLAHEAAEEKDWLDRRQGFVATTPLELRAAENYLEEYYDRRAQKGLLDAVVRFQDREQQAAIGTQRLPAQSPSPYALPKLPLYNNHPSSSQNLPSSAITLSPSSPSHRLPPANRTQQQANKVPSPSLLAAYGTLQEREHQAAVAKQRYKENESQAFGTAIQRFRDEERALLARQKDPEKATRALVAAIEKQQAEKEVRRSRDEKKLAYMRKRDEEVYRLQYQEYMAFCRHKRVRDPVSGIVREEGTAAERVRLWQISKQRPDQHPVRNESVETLSTRQGFYGTTAGASEATLSGRRVIHKSKPRASEREADVYEIWKEVSEEIEERPSADDEGREHKRRGNWLKKLGLK